jgi:signal transduction histidine kinase
LSSDIASVAFEAGGDAEVQPARSPTAARRVLLSTLPAGRRARRLATAVALVSIFFFIATAPFAKLPLAPVWAFIPIYQSALVVIDLITAVLLFAQFRMLGSRGLLLLASGYLFTAFMAIAHAMTFPGLFAAGGLLGAGPQTTAWLYMFWHGGFPLLVIAYALLREEEDTRNARRPASRAVALSIVAVGVAAAALTLLATAGKAWLPAIMQGNAYTPAMTSVVTGVWLLSLGALAALWRRRPLSILDLWLMAVMCAWLFDIALAAVLNAGRFDLGFYAGRIYGLLATSIVLIVLLLENSALYVRLVEAHEKSQRSLARHAERLRILHEIDRAVVDERTSEAIAAAVIQPLRQLLGVPRVIVNKFDLAAGEVEWISAAGRRRTHVGPGVRYSIRLMGDVAALSRGEPQMIDVHALPPGPEAQALLDSDVHAYMVVPMIAGGELLGALSFGGSSSAFLPEQVNIVQEVATQLAIAITQARLLERVKGQAAELELRVRERTAELEAFSYSVSHDLRAPLRAVDGYARMLEEDYAPRLDQEGLRLLAVIRESSRHMGQLIDDLLDLSRLGRQELAKRPVDMTALAREVAAELRPQWPAAEVRVASLPPVVADRSLLKQVWLNLIGNALKYSSKRVRAIVEIDAQPDGPHRHYWVKDNGAGFDMRYAGKLFGVFQRLHQAGEFSGTGVGLAIVQRLVARHGGRAWGEGRLGEGACFHFTLPGEDA